MAYGRVLAVNFMENFRKIEEKWSEVWKEEGIYEPHFSDTKKKFYNLMMFPYPSAEGLHVGNMYAFTGTDIYGRMKRMQGYDVFEPIGLDGFGIHSENYALKIGTHPMKQAQISQKHFYEQLGSIGNGFAWNERIETYDPRYYRWTQWFFVQMWKHGLAYRKKQEVNWCPSCMTVLADEQVEGGKCERCGTEVVRKELEQWFFRITRYAEKLLQNLDTIDWTGKIKTAQRNWIGKSEGAKIEFPISDSRSSIEVFTTRPDTLFGVTYLVLAPEFNFSEEIREKIGNKEEVDAYIQKAKKKTSEERVADKEKTGVELKGIRAMHPASREEIPVFVADYILSGYGTGAVMAVPAHDARDFSFAEKYGLEIKEVILSDSGKLPYVGEGTLKNSGEFNGLSTAEAIQKIGEKFGKMETQYRLRDWLISRQRYWGPPIPMVFCETCAKEGKGERADMPGWYSVPEKDLPVELPYVEDFRPRGKGDSPLASVPEFYKTTCPGCGGPAKRETDVSDTFLDSAWYYIGYLQKISDFQHPISGPEMQRLLKNWLPVDMYIGGAEHSVLHLLYVRFAAMVLHDFGFIDFEEPFPKFRAHGLLIKDGAKISKSKGNIINPDKYIAEFGADAFRMYLMFLAPFEQGGDFRDEGILGIERFLKRVGKFSESKKYNDTPPKELKRLLNRTIKKVTDDIEGLRYNTAISSLMILLNAFEDEGADRESFEVFLKLLAPFAPFITEEIWRDQYGHSASVHKETFPEADEAYLKDDVVTIAVQIEGKMKGTIQVPAGSDENMVLEAARNDEKIKKQLDGKNIQKTIFVRDKIINFLL